MTSARATISRSPRRAASRSRSAARHAGTYITSFYAWNPSGFMTEYGWGAQSIDPATWQPFERKFGASLWGHDRSWMTPDKQIEARELRRQAAEAGLPPAGQG